MKKTKKQRSSTFPSMGNVSKRSMTKIRIPTWMDNSLACIIISYREWQNSCASNTMFIIASTSLKLCYWHWINPALPQWFSDQYHPLRESHYWLPVESIMWNWVRYLLGIRLIARSGLSTRTVRIVLRLSFSTSKQYSNALKNIKLYILLNIV